MHLEHKTWKIHTRLLLNAKSIMTISIGCRRKPQRAFATFGKIKKVVTYIIYSKNGTKDKVCIPSRGFTMGGLQISCPAWKH